MPVVVELPAEYGRVIFLPALRSVSGDARYAMSDMLQAGIRRALGVMAEGRSPGWIAEASLPGIEERRSVLNAARTGGDQAEAASQRPNRHTTSAHDGNGCSGRKARSASKKSWRMRFGSSASMSTGTS